MAARSGHRHGIARARCADRAGRGSVGRAAAALDRLSPLERAAFLLHDVFDYSFTQVAEALGRNEAACRQLASRARTRVREARPAGRDPAAGGVERESTRNTRSSCPRS